MATQVVDTQLSDALRTVAVNGSYSASRALSKWLRRGVRLTSDGFRSVPVAEVSSVVGDPDDPIAAIHLPLKGDLAGHMLLTFPESVALSIADIIMQAPEGTSTQFGDLEQSCLQETGNIVASAYANSLAKWLHLKVEPGVPVFVHDMASSVIDPLVAELLGYRDEIFVSMTDFLLDKKKMEWGLLLLPTTADWELMEKRCQMDDVRQNALRTIAVNGAFNASRAMSKWLKRGVKISTEGFTQVALSDVTSQFDDSDPIVALLMPLTGHVRGHTLLAMHTKDALRLADLLLGQPLGTSREIGELERSCLEETGNIISSSFLNGWATWLDMPISPGAPQFVHDLPDAVVDGVLSDQARMSDEVYLARTDFIVDDQWLEWVFLLVPAPSAIRLIETACR